MSKATWLKEFMPIDADQADNNHEAELDHSLQKWQGLLPKNLSKHGMHIETKPFSTVVVDTDGEEVKIGASTCALCVHHATADCDTCPIKLFRGIPCDEPVEKYPGTSPWHSWVKENNS